MDRLSLRSHPLRASLSEEMHVRRLPRFAAPCRLMQIVTVLGEEGAASAGVHFDAIGARVGVGLAPSAKYAVVDLDGMKLVLERHTEFASYTFIREGAFDQPFSPDVFDPVAADILEGMPGDVIRATQIAVYPPGTDPPAEDTLDTLFVPEALILCDVSDGKARVMSDFRLNPDGFGRLLLFDQGLLRDEPAQLVLRLQELGNYRNMALLGLPLAQRLTPDVSRLEARLATLTAAVSERVSQDDSLLDELTYLSAELARLLAETRYRMSATRAYAQLSLDRLETLGIGRIPGYQTLADFTERRLTPAVRTCDSFSARLADLSQRAAWTSELLRTRIDIALAKQNRDLLASMNTRTHLQLRLQQTVEGLSVVAISYYAVALIGYLAAPAHAWKEWVMVAAVPLVFGGAWLFARRLRRGLEE
ncbi:DUF3422 domain-containing protein [Sphingomonas sp. TREG-RG-20F-R18-01]|uniref:DUF3422 family protein n=1 Tax=Sphingomonas sp. TREG-RG-20F-R18-01 TaxID=2914982 RepID=UPI001F59963C|nr:DUF3422 domain-containing protein [Sphingomonas sp. TREG-RG-20F-R18-01]